MPPDESPAAIEGFELLIVGAFSIAEAEAIARRLSRFVGLPCRVRKGPDFGELPILVGRDQIDADALLEQLEALPRTAPNITVGLTSVDLGIVLFTFVFGRARLHGDAAVVSLARLRPEFYGFAADPTVTERRAVAEILHEVGHTQGLEHCRDYACLMSFAADVETIDLRGLRFCDECASRFAPGFLVETERTAPG